MSDPSLPHVAGPDANLRVCRLRLRNVAVLNISHSGMAIATDAPLVIGGKYVFLIRSAQAEVLLEGVAVRVNLEAIAENEQGENVTVYHNGIAFRIERNPKEIGLMTVIRDSAFNEKRWGAARVRPVKRISVDVAQDRFSRLTSFGEKGFSAESNDEFALDESVAWLICAGEDACHVPGKVTASAKKDASVFQISARFESADEATRQFLREAATRWPRPG